MNLVVDVDIVFAALIKELKNKKSYDKHRRTLYAHKVCQGMIENKQGLKNALNAISVKFKTFAYELLSRRKF